MLLVIYVGMALFLNQNMFSQNGFIWDSWVGCNEGGNDRKNYSELIAEGLCHRTCQQSTVTYTITGAVTSQMTNTIWHVVGGSVLSTPNNSQCIVRWGSTSTGAIGFTTTQVATNTSVTIADLCVNLTINPIAAYTIAPVDPSIRPPNVYNACTGQELFFENLSSTNGGTAITSYYWDFGDGTTSSQESPSHTFSTDGIYKVILKVDNQCNCSSTIYYDVIVSKKGVQIDCPSIVCEGQKATYKVPDNFAATCTQFNWSVIGGTIQQNPPYSKQIEVLWSEHPPTNGFGYVTFDPVNCAVDCFKPTTLKIPIIKQTATIVGETDLCGPTQVLYKLPQWPTTDFVWKIVNANGATATLTNNDQRNEILLNTGNTAGTVTLKCSYTNTLLNCGGVATPITITIKQPATISGASQTCLGSTEIFTEATGQSVTWQLKKLPSGTFTNFVGANFSHTFVVAGEYSLTATGPYICNPISKLITVTNNATPLAADFTSALTICPGATTTYTFNNTAPGTVIRWQVTGGSILGSSVGNSVQIVFGLSPTYSIKLVRENASGIPCASGILTLLPFVPTPNLTIKGETLTTNPIIEPCGSSSAIYQVAQTDMDFYEWEILPANVGSVQIIDILQPWIIKVQWNQFSNQSATLRLKSKKCLKEEIIELPIIIKSPTVVLTPSATSICKDDVITFTLGANLTSFAGTILWDFGNGQTQTTTTTSIAYQYTFASTANINYQVKATIIDPNGCSSIVVTTPVNIQVKMPPVAYITPSSDVFVTAPAAITFLPASSRTLTVTLSVGYAATNTITWYRFANNIETVIPLPNMTTSYEVQDFGSYYARVANTASGCSSLTNKVEFGEIIPDTTPTCPANVNPTLTLSNNCGIISAIATNIGNPESVLWRTSIPGLGPLPGYINTAASFNINRSGQYAIKYIATYNVNGVICKVIKSVNIIIPYIPDLRYSISCGTGLNYNIKLFNNSNIYPSTPPTVTYKIRKINVPPTANVTTTYTAAQVAAGVALPAGNYVAIIELIRTVAPASPICIKEIPFTLVAKPTVAFTKSSSSTVAGTSAIITTCPGAPVFCTITGPVNPNYTYLWDFGNNATFAKPNDLPTSNNVFVTYTSSINYFIKLTVKDQYGCTFTTAQQQVTVISAPQITKDQTIDIKKCAGTQAILSFSTVGLPLSSIPVSYKWMRGNYTAPGPGNFASNGYTTSVPGNYWLQTANASGCFKRVIGYSVTVSFIDIPLPIIAGPSEVCLAQGANLTSYNGTDPAFQYIWWRNGVVVNNTSSFTDYPPATGIYTYTLEVKATLGDSTFCSKISSTKTVSYIESPIITGITYENIINPLTGTCNPFKIRLKATANAIGTFAWSNGKNGAIVEDTSGGAYAVLFTMPSGCTATAQIYVPKDLSTYMWVVPKGCYTFCDKLPLQQVIGPAIQEFASWAWLQNTVPTPAGTNAVTPKNLSPITANYQLQLGNNVCNFKSDPFSITYENCDRNLNCTFFSAALANVSTQTTPFLSYYITLAIANTSGSEFTVIVTTANQFGFFIPATITVPPGGGSYTVTLVPNSVLSGTSINILLTTTDRNGNLCQKFVSTSLGGVIDPSNRKGNKFNAASTLTLFPNPSSDTVTIAFNYGTITTNTELILYDTTARRIASYYPTNAKGVWELSVDNLAAGMYIVVMKQEGQLVAQRNLIKK